MTTNGIRLGLIASFLGALGCSSASPPASSPEEQKDDPRAAQYQREALAEIDQTDFRCEAAPGGISVVFYMSGTKALLGDPLPRKEVIASNGGYSATYRGVTLDLHMEGRYSSRVCVVRVYANNTLIKEKYRQSLPEAGGPPDTFRAADSSAAPAPTNNSATPDAASEQTMQEHALRCGRLCEAEVFDSCKRTVRRVASESRIWSGPKCVDLAQRCVDICTSGDLRGYENYVRSTNATLSTY